MSGMSTKQRDILRNSGYAAGAELKVPLTTMAAWADGKPVRDDLMFGVKLQLEAKANVKVP